MRSLFFIVMTVFGLATLSTLQAQQEERRTPRLTRGEDIRRAEKESNVSDLTVRAQIRNEQLTQDIENARWMRIIYRELDLTQEENAPLYYPLRPSNGSMNLFSTLFQLVSEGKIGAYEYLDGFESFEEEYQMDFKHILDNFHILYDSVPGALRTDPTVYVVNESDIPSDLVKKYYVKEAYYFDQNNSIYDVKTLAICPIMITSPDYTDGSDQQIPMFWVPYEMIRPYISNSYIMTSNINNARTFSMDDFFRRRMFNGDIIKTENLMNLPLQAYAATPDSLKKEQERIEGELKTFEEALWFKPDTTEVLTAKEKKAAKKTVAPKEKKTKEKEVKAAKPKVEKSSPVRSVRRGRRG